MNTKLKVCSIGLAVTLWSIVPVSSADIQIEKDSKGVYHPIVIDYAYSSIRDSFIDTDESAIDTEWADFRGAVYTEWA